MDILATDPLGTFELTIDGVKRIGTTLAALHLPTVICMEGGYNHELLGEAFAEFAQRF